MTISWMSLGILSALFLGCYETSKKKAVHDNAVLPTLFISVLAGACCMLPVLLVNSWSPSTATRFHVSLQSLTWTQHLAILGKSALVGTSWICAYLGLKHLPLSIASPVRASAPLWTLLGAVILLNEMPAPLQWLGLIITAGGYFALSLVGRKEGILFQRNPWVFLVLAATLLGTVSALWDKILLHDVAIEPIALQVWFSIYLVPFIGLLTLLFWFPQRWSSPGKGHPFRWTLAAPLTGALLIAADASYFAGLAQEEASIALMSAIRRSSVAVAVIAAGLFFHEVATKKKLLVIGVIIGGVCFIILGDTH
jgi:drug/metabolite transporter (DMT)-like permease